MTSTDNKLATASFWLWLGIINHAVALLVIILGCTYSGFACQGESMRDVLSVYAFTLFTPQLALEAILLLALFLVISSAQELRDNRRAICLFVLTLSLLIFFLYWRG